MADIEQAANWLLEGKKVRRSKWNPKSYLVIDELEALVHGPMLSFINTQKGLLYKQWTPSTLLAKDWELFKD